MSRVVQVPSGVVFDLDRVVMGLTSDQAIGQVGLVMSGSPDLVPNITKGDVEALVQAGLVIKVQPAQDIVV